MKPNFALFSLPYNYQILSLSYITINDEYNKIENLQYFFYYTKWFKNYKVRKRRGNDILYIMEINAIFLIN